MGFFSDWAKYVFGTRKPKAVADQKSAAPTSRYSTRFNPSQVSNVKLYPTEIRVVLRTRIKTLSTKEKEQVFAALRGPAKDGLREYECRKILHELRNKKIISFPDYDALIRLFGEHYSR